jgi:hypothetical protein
MVTRRTLTLLGGLGLSLLISIGLTIIFDAPVFLLVLPFIPLLGWGRRERRPRRTCPTCGFESRDPAVAYCPRDGTELETRET